MALHLPRFKPRQKHGRPKINWDPWCAKMHDHMLEGETERRASDLVAQDYRDEIPQGSTHGQRSDESTARLLRKYYPSWLKRQAELEETQAIVAHIQALFPSEEEIQRSRAAALDTPLMRAATEIVQAIEDCQKHIPQLEWAKRPFEAPRREQSRPAPASSRYLNPKIRRNKSQNRG
jgi:hypothetical protein